MKLLDEKEINDKNELYETLMRLADNKYIFLTGCLNTLSLALTEHSRIGKNKPTLYRYKKIMVFVFMKKSSALERILQIDNIWDTIALIFAQELDEGCATAQIKYKPDKTKEYSVNGFAENILASVESLENE